MRIALYLFAFLALAVTCLCIAARVGLGIVPAELEALVAFVAFVVALSGAAIVEAVAALTVATREASAARDVRALHDLVADARDVLARK